MQGDRRLAELIAMWKAALFLIGLTAVGEASAQEIGLADPASLVAAFRERCVPDFPATDLIARKAIAAGWIERKVSFIGEPGNGLSGTNLPRFFNWRGLSLSLVRPGGGIAVTGCQVTAPPAKSLGLPALVSATTAQLGLALGEPTLSSSKGDQKASWRLSPDRLVEAAVLRYGRTRTLSLNILIKPEPARQ